MKKSTSFLFVLSAIALCSFSVIPQKQLNPNGDSELAILMRGMFDEGMKIKEAVASGEKVDLEIDYDKLLTATATEPEKAASPTYKAMAQVYMSIMEKYKEADLDESKALYLDMVNTCKACHKSMCPGPLVRIKLLDLEE